MFLVGVLTAHIQSVQHDQRGTLTGAPGVSEEASPDHAAPVHSMGTTTAIAIGESAVTLVVPTGVSSPPEPVV